MVLKVLSSVTMDRFPSFALYRRTLELIENEGVRELCSWNSKA